MELMARLQVGHLPNPIFGPHRVRAAARHARDLAIDLKVAERRVIYLARGFNEGAAGFTAAELHETEERAARARAALDEACFHDAGMARSLRRSVA